MKTQRFRIFLVISQRDVIHTRVTSILLRHVINSVILPGTSLVYPLCTTNQNSTYFMTVFIQYTKHVFSNIKPSSRHIPDRDLCSVHMEPHSNKFYS